MKLLFDNNLSHKLVARVNDLFPGSTHVMLEGMDNLGDKIIWEFAKENGFVIVTKDSDYNEMSLIYGFPPKIIWITAGNCKIQDVEQILRENSIPINEFYHKENSGIIEIS